MFKKIAFATAVATAIAASVYTINYSSTSSNRDFTLAPSKIVETKEYEQFVTERGFEFEEHFVTT